MSNTDVESQVESQAGPKFDPEAFSLNLARAMEQGGRALAAYLKPRQAMNVNDRPPSELAEIIKKLMLEAARSAGT